jgi:hypothetical protein
VEDECIERMAEVGRRDLPTAWREQLEQPITPGEVHIDVRKGGKKKAPGSDGLGLEFYKANWATIKEDMGELMNQMFMERRVTATEAWRDRVPAQDQRTDNTGGLLTNRPPKH